MVQPRLTGRDHSVCRLRDLVRMHDPAGKFGNAFVDRYLLDDQ
jgi:hypothetical protein